MFIPYSYQCTCQKCYAKSDLCERCYKETWRCQKLMVAEIIHLTESLHCFSFFLNIFQVVYIGVRSHKSFLPIPSHVRDSWYSSMGFIRDPYRSWRHELDAFSSPGGLSLLKTFLLICNLLISPPHCNSPVFKKKWKTYFVKYFFGIFGKIQNQK